MTSARSMIIAAAIACVAGAASAQTPDLNGMWQAPYTPDLTRAYGRDLPFTPYGAERWKTHDNALDPTGFCLPVGPARGIQAPMPFLIVQTRDLVSILFEYQRTFRLIYVDGRPVPADVADNPEWMGFSVGRWDGDTLVVETAGINDRTWLDTAGHEHSDKLKLTERFRTVDANTIEWTVVFDDPVFFTAPWSITRPLTRQKATDRILSYSCEENNRDLPHLIPGRH